MQGLLRCCVLAVLLLLGAASQAGADLESQLRQALKVPPDYSMVYQSEDGATLTSAEAMALLAKGGSLTPSRDDQKKRLIAKVQKPPPPLKALPAFDFKTLEGKRLRNADLAGKPTMLSFFFATCVPCIKEIPALNALKLKHPEFHYLAVTFDSQADASSFTQQRKFTWPVLAEANAFIEAAGVKGYPTYMLVAADGRVLARNSGIAEDQLDDPKAIQAHFEKWLAENLK